MSAWDAVQAAIGVLRQELPNATIADSKIGIARPSATGDVPAIAVSADETVESLGGVGRVVSATKVSDDLWSSDTISRSTGALGLEVWAGDETRLGQVVDALFGALADEAAVRSAGFLRLAGRSIGPGERLPLPGGGDALRLAVSCAYVHETTTAEDTGPGGIIRTVHVDIEDEFDEAMDLP
jgi:hypothetical protein